MTDYTNTFDSKNLLKDDFLTPWDLVYFMEFGIVLVK